MLLNCRSLSPCSSRTAWALLCLAVVASLLFIVQYKKDGTLVKANPFLSRAEEKKQLSTLCSDEDFQDYFDKTLVPDVSPEEMFRYFHWENKTSCLYSFPFGGILMKLHSTWARDGQKELCMEVGVAPVRDNCLIYSFGINNEWSYDDALESFGCDVFSFDPSMKKGDHLRGSRIHFFKMGLSGRDTVSKEKNWTLRTLSSIYSNLTSVHGQRNIDQLKIDIEFAEWETLPQMVASGMLDKVKQIALEIHFERQGSLQTFRNYYRILRSLEEYGFYRFSSRPNPWLATTISLLDRNDYSGFELTWYNSKFRK